MFCPTAVQSNSLRSYYDAILVWTGSAGFESALRGKPVLCASQPYYFTNEFPFFLFSMNTETSEIERYISEYSHGNERSHKLELVRHLLDGCLPGRVRFDGSWTPENEEYVKEATVLAGSLKEFIETHYFADIV